MDPERARVEVFLLADNNLASVALDLHDIERRTGGHAQALALPDGEVVNPRMLAETSPSVVTNSPAVSGSASPCSAR